MAAGLTLASIGAVGSFTAPDPASPRTAAERPEEPPRRERTPRARPEPTEPKASAQETPEEFYTLWVAAFRAGDGDFLFERLHPLVLQRYGEQRCITFTDQLQVDDFAVDILRVRTAKTFVYTTDGESDSLSSALPIRIRLTSGGRTSTQTAHVAYAGDELHWFTDCGDPL